MDLEEQSRNRRLRNRDTSSETLQSDVSLTEFYYVDLRITHALLPKLQL